MEPSTSVRQSQDLPPSVLVTGTPPMWVHSNCMGRGDDTPLNLGIVQNGNGLRTPMTQESQRLQPWECQSRLYRGYGGHQDGFSRGSVNRIIVAHSFIDFG